MKAEYITHSGDDLLVVNAARVSFDKISTLDDNGHMKPADINLINYLARGVPKTEWLNMMQSLMNEKSVDRVDEIVTACVNMAQHWAPFAHPHISIRMQAPTPIRVQCFKHKVGFVESEESRRYISSSPALYIPEYFAKAPDNKKQGSSGKHAASEFWVTQYRQVCGNSIDIYERMISAGIAPEDARFILPQGVEVNWVWTGSLAAFARYYNQRSDPHAQRQSQFLAEEVSKIVSPLYPVSWQALTGN